MKKEERQLLLLFILFIGYWLLVGLSACTTATKATRYMDNHEEVAAPYCATRYPIVIGKPDSTAFQPGDSTAYLQMIDELHQSLWAVNVINDSLLRAVHVDSNCRKYETALRNVQAENQRLSKRLQNIECPKDKEFVYIPYESTAKLKTADLKIASLSNDTSKLNQKIADLKQDVKEEKDGKSKWRLWCLITWGIIAGYVVLRTRKLIPF